MAQLQGFWAASLCALAGLAAPPAAAADAKHPTVVELFQSQGCSSCPPANAALIQLSDRPDLLTLTFAVDYWDRLGWKDTFASHAFTQRQYDYAASLHGSVYTPETIANGRVAGVGGGASEMLAIAQKGDRGDAGPALSVADGVVSVGAGAAPAGGADVWVALYDPSVRVVKVQRGENAGADLPHKNVVRDMVLVGRWTGAAAQFKLPALGDGLARAVLVQTAGVGPILAAIRG